MSFSRHGEIYHFDEGAIPQDHALAHRNDEFPAGYSLAGCAPAEPAAASPAGAHLAGKVFWITMEFQRTARSALTVCLTPGDNPRPLLCAISNFVPYVPYDPCFHSLIEGSLNYCRLYLAPKGRDWEMRKWIPDRETVVEDWLKVCARNAWQIVVARESRSLKEKDLIMDPDSGIPQVLALKTNYELMSEPSQLYFNPTDSLMEQFPNLAWDFASWVLAALTNAIKWSGQEYIGKGTGRKLDHSLEVFKRWIKISRKSKRSPFRLTRVVVSVSERDGTTISVYNGCQDSLSGDEAKAFGTKSVLETILSRLPSAEPLRFEKIKDVSELRKHLPGESAGFVTSVHLSEVFFTPRRW